MRVRRSWPLIVVVLLLAGGSVAQAGASRVFGSTSTTLTICMSSQPDSLYLYGSTLVASSQVRSILYPGPFTNVNYEYQPFIMARLPSSANGDVALEPVTVDAGATVINSSGSKVALAAGEWVRPSGCYQPGCAVQYGGGQFTMDRERVTYTLLPGVTWSDGHPVQAHDSVYSYELDMDPDTPSVKDAGAMTAGYVEANEMQTMWTGWPGYTPPDVATYFWTPLPQHAWSGYTPAQLVTADISKRYPMGWGPYIIDSWTVGSQITMHKNPNYFRAGEGLPRFDNVLIRFTQNTTGELVAGTCDLAPTNQVTGGLPAAKVYDNDGTIRLQLASGNAFEHIDFGINSDPSYTGFAARTHAFQDVRIRQAFAYCMERAGIARWAGGAYASVMNAYVSDSHPYYPPDAVVYPLNAAAGRALLEQAGWTDTNGDGIRDKNGEKFSVVLSTNLRSDRLTVANMIAANLRTNCGIELTPNPTGSFFSPCSSGGVAACGKFDLAMFAWITDHASCSLWDSAGGQNYTRYSNPTFDTACRQARSVFLPSDMLTYYRAVIRLFTQEIPSLGLYSTPNAGATRPQFAGFKVDSTEFGLWTLDEVSVGITQTIQTSGGTLGVPDDATTFTFPAGTFSEPVTVEYLAHPLTAGTPVPTDQVVAGHVFDVSANNAAGAPAEPVPGQTYTVVIHYTPLDYGLLIENTLALYYWDGSQWVKESSSVVDTGARIVTAQPGHFSTWALLGDVRRVYLPLTRR